MILRNKDLLKKTLKLNSSVEQLINNLNENQIKLSIIIDYKKRIVGTISDGDLRRGFLRGLKLNDKINSIINYKPVTIQKNNFSEENAKKILNINQIDYVPVVKNKKLLFLYSKKEGKRNKVNKYDVIIMAGGFGKRLKRLTKTCPKPLLKYKNKPLIQHIIDKANNQGFKNFYISIYYLKNRIKKYFNKNKNKNINIKYLEEKTPLGTIGSLRLLKNISKNFVVLNCDVITDVNMNEVINFHIKKNCLMTMCVKHYRYQNPYGVIKSKNSLFKGFEEKPSIDFKINAGIYIFSSKIIHFMKKYKFKNVEELINNLKKKNKKISLFPIYENWHDLGSDIKNLKKLS